MKRATSKRAAPRPATTSKSSGETTRKRTAARRSSEVRTRSKSWDVESLSELPVEVLERALALARAKRVEPVQLAFADPMVAKGTTGLRQPNAGDTVIGEQESQRGQNAQGTRKPSDRQAPKRWPESVVAFTDGACRGNPGPSSVGVVFLADGGEALGEVSETVGTGTNNEAEYKAVIRALEVARSHGVSQLLIRADSELMVRQMQGVYQVKAESIRPLFNRAKMLLREFRSVRFEHVRREANREADRLANEALDRSN